MSLEDLRGSGHMSALPLSSLVHISTALIIYQETSNMLVNGGVISVVFESIGQLHPRILREK